MATLGEIAEDYEKSAVLIRARLKELRGLLAVAEDYEERWKIKRRIAELTPMLTQCNKLAKHCKHYYDKGFYIGDGAVQCRRKYTVDSREKQASLQGCSYYYRKGTDSETAGGRDRMSNKWEDFHRVGGRKRRKQVDYFSHVLSGDS